MQEPLVVTDSDSDLPDTSISRSESLEEYRRIRREQDEAYQLSLEADRVKV